MRKLVISVISFLVLVSFICSFKQNKDYNVDNLNSIGRNALYSFHEMIWRVRLRFVSFPEKNRYREEHNKIMQMKTLKELLDLFPEYKDNFKIYLKYFSLDDFYINEFVSNKSMYRLYLKQYDTNACDNIDLLSISKLL